MIGEKVAELLLRLINKEEIKHEQMFLADQVDCKTVLSAVCENFLEKM